MKKILLYKDEGASLRSLQALVREFRKENLHEKYEIVFVDRHHLAVADWIEETVLLVFPGGRDVPYHQALQGAANSHIQQFVLQGGKYLGICAGSYYGSAFVEFEKGNPLQVCEARELKFFPGIASGPAYGAGEFNYGSEQGARLACLSWQKSSEQKMAVYYNGGCSFVDAESHPDVTVIARYDDIKDSPAAIIACSVGKGIALLSGVHPEYTGQHLPANDPFLATIVPELKEREQERRGLFQHMVEWLGL